LSKKKIVSFVSLILSDCITILASFILAYLIRSEVLPLINPSLLERPVFFDVYIRRFYMLAVWIVVFLYERLYTRRYSFWDETRYLFKSTTIAFSFTMIGVFITQEFLLFSRFIILLAWLFSLLLLPVSRYLVKTLLIGLRIWEKKVMIVCSGAGCASLIEAIKHNKTLGYRIIGVLSDSRDKNGSTISGIKVMGHLEELADWKERTGFEDIIVTLPDLPGDRLIELLKKWDQNSETIRYVPRTGDLITAGVEIENIGRHLALSVRKNLEKPWNILIKGIFEYLLAVLMTVFFLPFFALIAAAIKLDSKGPVFFIQQRYGKKGRRFRLIKFRSMFSDADARLQRYLENHPEKREEWLEYKKLRSRDPRVTRVGRLLRKYSLDELPQLFNVLKREMNLVGPRPYIMEELKEVESMKSILLRVKPGITGLWQISGRSKLMFKERLNLDEYYLRNWSLWLDIVILIKTVRVFLSGEGAY